MRLRIRNPFYFTESKIAVVQCAHCGKQYGVTIPNLRAVNYCSLCK